MCGPTPLLNNYPTKYPDTPVIVPVHVRAPGSERQNTDSLGFRYSSLEMHEVSNLTTVP